MVYFLGGEGKIADVDQKVDDVVLADLPVLVLLSLLVVVHHPLKHQPGVITKSQSQGPGPFNGLVQVEVRSY